MDHHQEYQDLNFQREALTVDPAKACQPLGAVLCLLALKRPCPLCTVRKAAWRTSARTSTVTSKSRSLCVSDSMTEDAAVFGGQKNMFDGLETPNAVQARP